MGTIKDKAKEYKGNTKIKNISEFSSVETNLAVFEDAEAEFPYSYIELDGERYKIPTSVLASLKIILEENPDLKKFKVKKQGEGIDTRYTVIPLA